MRHVFGIATSQMALAGTALALSVMAAAAEPVVLAAASTGRAMDAVIAASGVSAVTSYSASGILARQIEHGAPADVFISANPKWMTHLVEIGLIDGGAVSELMSNALVLIAPEGSRFDPTAPAAAMDGMSFVMADPAVAPVGRYGQAAFETLGLWHDLAPHFVPTRNTLATVAAVQSGEAALGLIYASDAKGRPGIEIVWSVPAEAHPPIRYLVAPLPGGDDAAGGEAMMTFLASDEGRSILAAHGFLPVGRGH